MLLRPTGLRNGLRQSGILLSGLLNVGAEAPTYKAPGLPDALPDLALDT